MGDLEEHVGWKRLREIAQREKDKFLEGFARRLMAGVRVESDEVAFHRGFYYGAQWIVEYPEEAVKSLQSLSRRAWVKAKAEAVEQPKEDSPYV